MTPITPISPFNKISAPLAQMSWSSQNLTNTPTTKTSSADLKRKMPWLKSKAITEALAELQDLQFAKEDIDYLKSIGVNVPFKAGYETVDFIKKQNIRIVFEKTTEEGIHAQYDFSKNLIIINEKYKNTNDFSVVLAIAEAILHETGHAKDNDGESSIQEELDFLGMNAIAHRAFLKKYGDVFSDSKDLIINDGVSVYAKLFFENDPLKKNLINRITSKYGELPSGDRIHPPQNLAREIKRKYYEQI